MIPAPSPPRHPAVLAFTAGWIALLGAAGVVRPSPLSAQSEPETRATLELVPSLLQLGSETGTVEVMARDVPSLDGFRFALLYDASAAVVTAVEAGPFLAATGGTAELRLESAEPGRLVVVGTRVPDPSAEAEAVDAPEIGDSGAGGAFDASTVDDASVLLGSGTLAIVSLAPLARTEAPTPISLEELELVASSGEALAAESLGAQLSVVEDPPADLVADAQAQAALLAEQASAGPGLAGIQRTIEAALRDLGRRAGGAGTERTPQLVWLSLLVLGLAVAGLGWYFGRRPPAEV